MPFRVQPPAQNITVGLCIDKSWMLVVGCDAYHPGRLTVADLARFPRETTMEQIAERLVCSTCGLRTGTLDIRQDQGAASARDVERFNASGKYEGS